VCGLRVEETRASSLAPGESALDVGLGDELSNLSVFVDLEIFRFIVEDE